MNSPLHTLDPPSQDTHNTIELLAPGGDIDSIKAAIAAGADAVYCGLGRFNARNRATNIALDDLNGILHLAHAQGCKVFLTLNIIIVETELPAFTSLLNTLVNTALDGIIVQDLGMLYLLRHCYPTLEVHGSTQLTTHNEGQLHFLHRLGVNRVNLSRELNLEEIRQLTRRAHSLDMASEVFVHGSNCISFSGLCYLSSVLEGRSGNRGRCSQPCRDRYTKTTAGTHHPLNLKDNCAYTRLKELADAGVDSLKIEGRIKKFHYVYAVVKTWRAQLQRLSRQHTLHTDKGVLYKVFNRDFTNAYLTGKIGPDMFIDNPRDNSALHLAETYGGPTEKNLEKAKRQLYDEKTVIINDVSQIIGRLSTEKVPLTLAVSGSTGTPLTLSVQDRDTSFHVTSTTPLLPASDPGEDGDAGSHKKKKQDNCLDQASLQKLLKPINDTEYSLHKLDLSELAPGLRLPFNDLTALKRRILARLRGAAEVRPAILPPLPAKEKRVLRPRLSVLIDSATDLTHCTTSGAEIHYQLPSNLADTWQDQAELLRHHNDVIPWFPAILIGDHYRAAVQLLRLLRPRRIVSNTTGIGYEACTQNIPWIAGPHLNIVNSYSLRCLQEHFDCAGAFLSNELNNHQIKFLKPPKNFTLHYSIYHPIMLMTCRQCLLQQVSGCNQKSFSEDCLNSCRKSATIEKSTTAPLLVEKSAGNYHCLYNGHNFLNTDIVRDIPDYFTRFLIDLRKIPTTTDVALKSPDLIALFTRLLHGEQDAAQQLKSVLSPTTNRQYKKGI